MKRRLAAVVAVGLFGSVAQAAEDSQHPIDAAFEKCIAADSSTAGMIGCAADAEMAWDMDLNAGYKDLVAALKGKSLEAARQAQRAWVAQRDKEFALQDALRGGLSGTMWGPIMADQRMSFVRARAQQLRAYIEFLKDGRP